MNPDDVFKSRIDLMKAYCDTAKSYVQLSTGALVLPLLFTQAIFGKQTGEQGLAAQGIPLSLRACWGCFLVSIGCGLLYQWLAIRLVWDELHALNRTRENAGDPGFRTTWWIPSFARLNRSSLYGAMVAFFFAGAFCFVLFAASRIR